MRGKGLLRDLVLIGVTAIAVTVGQAYAARSDQTSDPDLLYTISCPTGVVVVTSVNDHGPYGASTELMLGHSGYYENGQITTLEDCVIEYYEE